MKELVGRRIVNVRMMTSLEKEREGWGDSPHTSAVLVLDDGSAIFASSDYEGNDSGALFQEIEGSTFTIITRMGKVKRI